MSLIRAMELLRKQAEWHRKMNRIYGDINSINFDPSLAGDFLSFAQEIDLFIGEMEAFIAQDAINESDEKPA